ncbi:unnamed protein product [Adineta ricciae]|uniref:RanBD1 domain-containing protein n=1 Tax=Adineta ricciae TaxID=249248 RepID=A0A815YKA4_ADIRI|nr:unnamed protein product [Adineta ricciae]CAF1571967.1 unnamed protein product [Adineta ricciae]
MSNNESATGNEDKTEKEANNVNTSTPVRLFGQFKHNGSGFSSFGQLSSSNGENSSSTSTSYFTSTLAKFSATNTQGFGSAPSLSLASSLAPLSANKQLFSATNEAKAENDATKEEDENGDAAADDDDEDDDEDEEENNKSARSLFETAAEYEARRATTHPSTTIQGDTSTGEEHEITKFQIAGKLYMYNPEQQQFVERGYGILKINESRDPSDWDKLQARLIMRLDKAFRVILNSPIFPKMTVERATDRSVRFGAQDESHLRIFVIKASANDCTNLCKELQSRIQIIERQQTTSSNNTSPNKSSLNTSGSSSVDNSTIRIRKRSHSSTDSDTSDNTANDISKKSKITEGYQPPSTDTSDEDSKESTKAGEQESVI